MADSPQADSDKKDTEKKMRERVDKLVAQAASQSSGAIRLGGQAFEYDVSAAFLPVVAEGFDGVLGEPQAAVLATSYVLKGADTRTRPVCFAFNGGPGSASIWLHLGALGPKRLATPDDGSMPTAPFAVADNPHTWFRYFDLVFIDPPHTGWSTTASVEARKKMLSVDGDVAALTEVMRVWLDAPQALELARVSRRRKLRHDARRCARRQAAELGRRALGADPDFVRDGPAKHRFRAGERPALFTLSSGLRQRLAISRTAEGRAREVAAGSAASRRGLRRRGLRRGIARGQTDARQGSHAGSRSESPS